MSMPDEVRRDAERTGELVRKKLLEIMELQADIDTLLRGDHLTPFGSKKWQYASLEALQRLVAMTAIQFVLFEPAGRVKGNDEFRVRCRRDDRDHHRPVEDAQDEAIRSVTCMDPKTIKNLEVEIEQAVAEVLVRKGLKRLPLLPSRRTMHLMSRAAVAVYEAAVEADPPRQEHHDEQRPQP